MNNDESVGVILATNAGEAKKQLDNLRYSVKNLSKDLSSVLQTSSVIAWSLAIKEVTQQMIRASREESEYIENMNLLKVSYHEGAEGAEELLDNANELLTTMKNFYGLDLSGVTKSLGIYKQMANAMDMTNETSALLSENLVKMQEDVSSLYNLDVSIVSRKFQSALAGQTRAVRDLGVDITKTALQQELYNRGINKDIDDMNRASKTVLIYLTMERQLAEAQGDAARTINGVANQTRIFTEQIKIASRQLGAVFIPVLKTILPYLNGFLMALNAIGEVILTLLGVDVDKLSSEFGISTASGLNDVEESALGASEAVDALNGKLRGFDKLNVITTPKDKSNSYGLGGVDKDLLNSMKEYNNLLDGAKNKAREVRDSILEWLGFTVDENGEIKGFKITLGTIVGGAVGLMVASKLVMGIWDFTKKIGTAIGLIPDDNKKILQYTKGLLSPLKNQRSIYKELRKEGKGIVDSVIETRKMWLELASPIEKIKGMIINISEILGGLTIAGMSWKSINDNGLTLANTIGLVAGAILTVKGAVELTQTAVSLFSTSLATNPFTLILGALIGVGGLIATLVLTQKEMDKTKDSFARLSDEEQQTIVSHENQMKAIQDLSGELDNLMDANGRVKKSDEDRVKYILNELNNAYGTEYELVDGQITRNGKLVKSYKEIESEIDKYVDKTNAQFLIERLKDKYNESLDKQYEKQEKINALEDTYKQQLEDLETKYKNGELSLDDYNTQVETLQTSHKNLMAEITNEYSSSEEFLKKYSDLSYAVTTGNMDDIKKYYDYLMGITVTNSSNYADEYAKTFTDALATASERNKGYVESITGSREEFMNRGKKDSEAYFSGWDYTAGKKKITVNSNSSGIYYETKPKAEGGWLDYGEIYTTRENGIPEMVGRIGNKGAVANNDQIVEAISIGVARAMSSAKPNQTVNIIADSDTEGLLNFINFKQQQRDRQYGF